MAANETTRIERALRRSAASPSVRGVIFELGRDADGAKAAYVRVVVTDRAAVGKRWRDTRARLRASIREALDREAPDRWVYVSFRTESEQER